MDEYTWEFDGRCPHCGSEDLEGDEDTKYYCTKCYYEFIVVINLKEALAY